MAGGYSKFREYFFGFLIFLASILVSLGAAEIALRQFYPQVIRWSKGLYVADDELGYVLAPGYSGVDQNPEFVTNVKISAQAMRERDLPFNDDAEIRILILGDSFTFGAGVEEADSYPRKLESYMREAGLAVEVINAGIPGYGTRKQAELYERIIDQVQPQIVIVGFFFNDYIDNLDVAQYAIIDGYLMTKPNLTERVRLAARLGVPLELQVWLRTSSHLYVFLTNTWTRAITVMGLSEADETWEPFKREMSPRMIRSLTETRNAFHKIRVASDSRNIAVGVVFIPASQVPESDNDYDQNLPDERLEQIAKENDLAYLTLAPDFRGSNGLYFEIDQHWTAAGHKLAAQLIAKSFSDGAFSALLAP